MTPDTLPTLELEEMKVAQANLSPHVVKTPAVPLFGLNCTRSLPDTRVWMKLEVFQKTGTFKARGALNVVMQLTPEQRARGITAFSAGNHAIAAAFAAASHGISAKIAVPESANPRRVAAARAYGAEIVFAPDGAAACAIAEGLVEKEGRTLIHPFEGRHTSLGTATVGLEFCEQVPELDAIVVAIGGGGLASGVGAAVKALNPKCQVFGVEPTGSDVMRRSFEAGHPVRLETSRTIADSLAPPMTMPIAYGLCRRYLDAVVTVDDDAICHALAMLFHDAKLAVEAAGATALAGLLGPLRETLRGKCVGVIVCGANTDRPTFTDLLKRGEATLLEASP